MRDPSLRRYWSLIALPIVALLQISFLLGSAAYSQTARPLSPSLNGADQLGPILVVLDQSGSMRGKTNGKIAGNDVQMMSVEGAQIVLGLLPEGMEFAAIPFSHELEEPVYKRVRRIDSRNDRVEVMNRLIELSKIAAAGSTEILSGGTNYLVALEQCQTLLNGKKNGTIVFLTDGDPQWNSDGGALPKVRQSFQQLKKAGHSIMFIDIHPDELDDRKVKTSDAKRDAKRQQGIELIKQLRDDKIVEYFQLEPPSTNKESSVKLLEKFMEVFGLGDQVNLYKIDPQREIAVYPSVHRIIAFGLGGKIRTEPDVFQDKKSDIYLYQSPVEANSLSLLNVANPNKPNYKFQMDGKGKIEFVISDPAFNIRYGVRGTGKHYAGTTATVFVEFTRRDGSVIPPELAKMLGVELSGTQASQSASVSLFETELKQVEATEKKVTLEAAVKLPQLAAGSKATRFDLNFRTLIKASEDNPWFLEKQGAITVSPLEGSLKVKLESDPSQSFGTNQAGELVIEYQLPKECSLSTSVQLPKDIDVKFYKPGTDLLVDPTNLKLNGTGSKESLVLKVQGECSAEFFGSAEVRVRCWCAEDPDQKQIRLSEDSTSFQFLKPNLKIESAPAAAWIRGEQVKQAVFIVTAPANLPAPLRVDAKLKPITEQLDFLQLDQSELVFKAKLPQPQKVHLLADSGDKTLPVSFKQGTVELELELNASRNQTFEKRWSGSVGELYTIGEPIYGDQKNDQSEGYFLITNHAAKPIRFEIRTGKLTSKDGRFTVSKRRSQLTFDDQPLTSSIDAPNEITVPGKGSVRIRMALDLSPKKVGDLQIRIRPDEYLMESSLKCLEQAKSLPDRRQFRFDLSRLSKGSN